MAARMPGKWLGKAAVLWVLDVAPADLPTGLAFTLLVVARHAGEDGCGAYPSAQDIAIQTRKKLRQVQRDLADLEKRGLLIRGDQRKAVHIPSYWRPVVWDLPIRSPVMGDVGVTSSATRPYGTDDATLRRERRTNRSGTDREKRARGAAAPSPPRVADLCKNCGGTGHLKADCPW